MAEKKRKRRPALTPEARENQIINMAMNLAEQQIENGTATSQLITHFVKLGSSKEKLEMEKLKKENELLKAKTESIQSMKNIEELYSNAIKAMRLYSGGGSSDEEL